MLGMLDHASTEIALIALIVEIPLLISLMVMSMIWSRRHSPLSWAHRIPIFYFDRSDVDVTELGGKVYQAIVLFVGLVLSFVLSCLMMDAFLKGLVYEIQNSVWSTQQIGKSLDFDEGRAPVSLKECRAGQFNLSKDVAYIEIIKRKERSKHFEYECLSRADLLRYGEKKAPQYSRWYPWAISALFVVLSVLWLVVMWGIFRPPRHS